MLTPLGRGLVEMESVIQRAWGGPETLHPDKLPGVPMLPV